MLIGHSYYILVYIAFLNVIIHVLYVSFLILPNSLNSSFAMPSSWDTLILSSSDTLAFSVLGLSFPDHTIQGWLWILCKLLHNQQAFFKSLWYLFYSTFVPLSIFSYLLNHADVHYINWSWTTSYEAYPLLIILMWNIILSIASCILRYMHDWISYSLLIKQ